VLFATVVCFVIRRHRRRSARCEATAVGTGCVNLQSGHENASQLVDMQSGRTKRYHGTFSHAAFPSVESLVEPPPAYIPAGGLLHDEVVRCVEGFQVNAGNLL